MSATLAPGSLVIVSIDGGKPGMVRYVCRDGYLGVTLVNERGRTDEWPASMVTPCSPRDAARAAGRFLPPHLRGES